MIEYDMINILERIDISKTNASKECDICHYWYFVDRNFKYESCPSNGSHELMQKAISFNDAAIISVKGSDYRISFWYMNKHDAINIIKNWNLNEKKGLLKISL